MAMPLHIVCCCFISLSLSPPLPPSRLTPFAPTPQPPVAYCCDGATVLCRTVVPCYPLSPSSSVPSVPISQTPRPASHMFSAQPPHRRSLPNQRILVVFICIPPPPLAFHSLLSSALDAPLANYCAVPRTRLAYIISRLQGSSGSHPPATLFLPDEKDTGPCTALEQCQR